MKTIGINGTSGFLGSHLMRYLAQSYQIIPIHRNDYGNSGNSLTAILQKCDIIINMAGASVFKRWTLNNKRRIKNSRIDTTRELVNALNLLERKPELFISFSAVGIYNNQGIHTEDSVNFANNFLSETCIGWEEEAKISAMTHIPFTICRVGVILGKGGGMLKKIKFPFEMGFGAVLGSGNQFFPYLGIHDFLRAISFVIEKHITGVVNMVAPDVCTNKEFSKAFCKVLQRPLWFRIPSFLLKLIFKQRSLLFLEGQNVIPKVLLDNGFEFENLSIRETLEQIFNRKIGGSY